MNLLLTGVVLAVPVALLRGGKISRLANLRFERLMFVWLAILLRAAVPWVEAAGVAYASWLQVGAYLLLFWAVLPNINLPGMKLFTLGTALNFLVIAANGGAMPVSPTAFKNLEMTRMPSGTHGLLTAETRLWWLADIIPVRLLSPYVISIGDILLVAGVFIFIQQRMLAVD